MADLNAELTKMKEWSRAVIFDEEGQILASMEYEGEPTDLTPFTKAYDSRDATVGPGFTFGGDHFDVHRFHPPLIYGRRGDCEVGEGISFARGKNADGKMVYMIICYSLPIVSARAIPQQINFFNQFVGTLESFEQQ